MHFFQLAAGESLYVVSKVEFLKNASLFPLPVGSLGALWLYFLLIFCGHPCGQQDHPRPEALHAALHAPASSGLQGQEGGRRPAVAAAGRWCAAAGQAGVDEGAAEGAEDVRFGRAVAHHRGVAAARHTLTE